MIELVYYAPVFDYPSVNTGSIIGEVNAGETRTVLSQHSGGWLQVAEGWIRPVKVKWREKA